MEKPIKKISGTKLNKVFPFLNWFKDYQISYLKSDFVAGLTVALVLIPQSMAYAQLAGLPAYYGLYAAFLPPLIAALFGSSRQLATGPVAVVSLMTATALEPIASAGSEGYIAYAIILALMVGLFQFTLGIFKLGLVVNFLSHPVVNGFTNAAALIIASSQLAKIFGVVVDKSDYHYQTIVNIINTAIHHTHLPTLGIAILAFAIMIVVKKINPRYPYVLIAVVVTTLISWLTNFEQKRTVDITKIGCEETQQLIHNYNSAIDSLEYKNKKKIELNQEIKTAAIQNGELSYQVLQLKHNLAILTLEIKDIKSMIKKDKEKMRLLEFKAYKDKGGYFEFCSVGDELPQRKYEDNIWYLRLGNQRIDLSSMTFYSGGAVVGTIPRGLPSFVMPEFKFDIMLELFPMAIIISLLGFMEAISIAKAMAAKTNQRLDPCQELIGQGLSNIVGSFFKSYAVSGSFSRSAVNLQSGAITGISNIVSTIVVMLTLLFFTPLLYYLPQAVLAAIIMMAVVGLINVKAFIHSWEAQKYDGIIGIITFVCTLAFAPHLDYGIIIGVALSLFLYLFRGMGPKIAMLSLHSDGTYRNKDRFGLAQCKHIAVIRYNGSLIFANVAFLENKVLDVVSSMPELKYILLVGNGINELDASGEEMLSHLVERLRESGLDIVFSGLNDDVIDTMKRTYLYYKIGEDHFYRNATKAIDGIFEITHKETQEQPCPLKEVIHLD